MRLGFDISERTVSRYSLEGGLPGGGVIHEWVIFLRSHREAIVAMNFFTAPTVTFGPLYVWSVVHHDRRKIVHFNLTAQEVNTVQWH